MNEDFNKEVEIDLLALVHLLLRKWWQIAIAVILCVGVTATYAYGIKEDEYTSKSSMIVQVSNEGSSDYQDLITGQNLVDTYIVVVESDRVLNELKSNLGLTYSNSTLKNMISVTNTNNTLIINLTVTGLNASETSAIANELVTIVKDLTVEFESLEDAELLDTAVTPDKPSGPNRILYMVIGILLGGILGAGFIIALEFLDRNVKTEKDIENKLGIRVLGMVPEYDLPEGEIE